MSGRALAGLRIVVTRSPRQAAGLSVRLAELGATPITVSTIAIEQPLDGGAALSRAIRALAEYDQIAVTSPNGARALLAAASQIGLTTALAPVSCIGPGTAAMFDDSPFKVNVVPQQSVAEGLVDALGAPPIVGARLLLVQAEVARAVLPDGLRAAGWSVDRVVGYRTVDGVISEQSIATVASADLITFTASSTVDRFVRLAGLAALAPTIATIGPITSQTLRAYGLEVAVQADPHTLDGLVDALIKWATS